MNITILTYKLSAFESSVDGTLLILGLPNPYHDRAVFPAVVDNRGASIMTEGHSLVHRNIVS